ncbi:hypothetical protein T05_14546 [Trichinella murrelli]|uniref:Uncharacterized protein n=1 Tax=Trichinella murrelli TaxID=144512 RepID=A0A0V0T789_9BILA|nr:hypothetical protein T05_14546 [Trichinella murrelli]
MDAGWAVRPYTTLNALCNEWTACIQQLMGDELGAGGYTGQNGKGRSNEGENEGMGMPLDSSSKRLFAPYDDSWQDCKLR